MKIMNTIDTRDLAKRKNELEELRDAVELCREELSESGIPAGTVRSEIPEEFLPLVEALDSAIEDFGDDEKEELAELENLESEISDFRHGETMILESDFQEYAEQLADDIGAIDRNAGWPCCHIDWDAAAESLKQDYIEVTYQGDEYLVRA